MTNSILRPGYLRWDGTKYVLDPSVEIVGPPGPPGPSIPGPPGPPGNPVNIEDAGTSLGNFPNLNFAGGGLTVVGETVNVPGASGTAGGDLSGTYPNPTVSGIRGNSVPSPSGSSTVLQWSGTALSWATVSGSGAGNGFAAFQSSSSAGLVLSRSATQSWLYQNPSPGGVVHFPTSPVDGDIVTLYIQAGGTPAIPANVTLNGGSNFIQTPYGGNQFFGGETPTVYSLAGVDANEGLLLIYQWSATFDAWLCLGQSGLFNQAANYTEVGSTWTIPPYTTLYINTSSASPVSTIELPSNLVTPGITVTVADPFGTWGTHDVVISYGSVSDSIENPGALGTYSSSVTLNTNGMSVTWQQSVTGKWKVISLVT